MNRFMHFCNDHCRAENNEDQFILSIYGLILYGHLTRLRFSVLITTLFSFAHLSVSELSSDCSVNDLLVQILGLSVFHISK